MNIIIIIIINTRELPLAKGEWKREGLTMNEIELFKLIKENWMKLKAIIPS